MEKLLSNRVVVVTGAGGLIGAAACELCFGEGARLALVGRTLSRLEDVKSRLDASGSGRTACFRCDLTEPGDVKRVIDDILLTFGGIDVLLNIAGGGVSTMLGETEPEQWMDIIDRNASSAYYMSKYAAPALEKSRCASIVNVSSNMGWGAIPGSIPYSTSKSAIDGLTRGLAIELAGKGIRCNAIAPGVTVQDPEAGPKYKTPPNVPEQYADHFTRYIDRIPLGRKGSATDMANAILFLASDMSAYITGQVLKVSGGLDVALG